MITTEQTVSPRLRYLFNRQSGRCFIVPMDHGIGMGAVPGLYDMRETIEQMAGTMLPMIAGSLPDFTNAFETLAADLKREAEKG